MTRVPPMPVRQREPRVPDKKHLARIRQMPCIVCGAAPPSEATHLRIGYVAGTGLKPPDFLTVPQCKPCHDEEGRVGPPKAWRQRLSSNPILAAMAMHALAESLVKQ